LNSNEKNEVQNELVCILLGSMKRAKKTIITNVLVVNMKR